MDDFEELVEEAIDVAAGRPARFMSNVAVVVEDEPPAGLPLLGLYQGVPLTAPHERVRGACRRTRSRSTAARSSGSSGGDPDASARQVRRVVLHEIAHHFGICDERLRELDRY